MTKKDQPRSQADKFRELDADEDEAAFEEKVRRVATAPKHRTGESREG